MAYSDRELLARLIECEAGGEGENGMKAVASVVMNRVTASGAEYARVGQGSIERSSCNRGSSSVRARRAGACNPQNIYNMRPTDVHYSIADWAMAGNSSDGARGCAVVFQSLFGYLPPEFSLAGRGVPRAHRRPLLLRPHGSLLRYIGDEIQGSERNGRYDRAHALRAPDNDRYLPAVMTQETRAHTRP